MSVVAVTLLGLAAPSWAADRDARRSASVLAALDEALARDDIGAAVSVWRTAVGLARGERRWEGSRRGRRRVAQDRVRPGDPCVARGGGPEHVRGGALPGPPATLAHGMVQVAERFATLGDVEVVERSLRMTDLFGPTVDAGAEALAALHALRTRWVMRLSQATGGAGAPP